MAGFLIEQDLNKVCMAGFFLEQQIKMAYGRFFPRKFGKNKNLIPGSIKKPAKKVFLIKLNLRVQEYLAVYFLVWETFNWV